MNNIFTLLVKKGISLFKTTAVTNDVTGVCCTTVIVSPHKNYKNDPAVAGSFLFSENSPEPEGKEEAVDVNDELAMPAGPQPVVDENQSADKNAGWSK
ncbi:MAG: hypothetical protein JJE22_14910, partial [Bacteroidia bacterium]|nr:hypothetical protein [Bacteroidia bacterium]